MEENSMRDKVKDNKGNVTVYENGDKILVFDRGDKSKRKTLRRISKASRKINRKK
jgi:hypothetical protein